MEPMDLESDLVAKAQASDRSAFNRLSGESRSRLTGFVRSRLGEGLRSRHDVEDVVQETLLRAYRSIGRFEWQGDGSFLRWRISIADRLWSARARGLLRAWSTFGANSARFASFSQVIPCSGSYFDRLEPRSLL